ncbi:hypothetical protein [Neisseria sp. Ec49-e6-T10]|uniref:hypothetical protein n=1 Tax=Neisseria sp. Ec49-e6-T10 TaxID=3140744 RepID=UPI003EBAF846
MSKKLYKLYYETYSYHGESLIESEPPDSDQFDLEDGELLGIYSSYDIASQKLHYFSKVLYLSNLKRLNIYDAMLDHSEWADGFITDFI